MIFAELYEGQGLGNQLFVYVATRAIAKTLGQKFGIKHPERFKAPKLLNLDWGDPVPDDLEYSVHNEYLHGQNSLISNPETSLYLTDKRVFSLTGNIKLEGAYESEGYFYQYLENINDWVQVNEEYEHQDTCSDDLCILNFRGGVRNNSSFSPSRCYWDNAIKRMIEYNSNMKFIVITDDPDSAKQMFPEFECYHRNVETEKQNPTDSWVGMWDYVALKNCKNIICSTTTFACFPLWANKNLKMCISPKYNFCLNTSNGWWCRGSSIFSYVTYYMDRIGNLMTPKECREEWKQFYLENNIYTKEDLDNNYEWY